MNEIQGNPALTAAENYEKNVVTYTTSPAVFHFVFAQ